jgi:nucleotide-binding universal stress UspA family protein
MTERTNRMVLVAVDFGEASARAVQAAGAIARHWPAQLRLLHAESPEAPAYFTHDQVAALAAQRTQLQAQAVAFLERFGRQHTSTPFDARVVPEPPTDAILEQAASADLVVIGTGGRRGPSRWWLGSVAERVLQEIDRPLLVVHAADDPGTLFSRVFVCRNADLSGERAMTLATELAGRFAGSVTDCRSQTQPLDTHDETLVIVGVPRRAARADSQPAGLSRIRSGHGAVLFVPEESS